MQFYGTNIKGSVYEIISKVTGHIPDDLESDMYLEADFVFVANNEASADTVELDQNEDWLGLAKKIKGEFEDVPMNGISYDLVSDNLPVYMYSDTKLMPIRANYLGNRNMPKFDIFEFSKYERDQRHSMPQQTSMFKSLLQSKRNVN